MRGAPWVCLRAWLTPPTRGRRDLTEIHPAWLTELAPHFYEVAEQKVMGKSEAKRKIAHLTEDEPFYKRVSFR